MLPSRHNHPSAHSQVVFPKKLPDRNGQSRCQMDPEGAAEVSPPPTVWGCRIHPPTLSTSRSGASPKYRHGGWILAAPSPGVGMGTPSTGTRGSRQRPRHGRLCSPPRRQRVRPGRGGGARGGHPKTASAGMVCPRSGLGGGPWTPPNPAGTSTHGAPVGRGAGARSHGCAGAGDPVTVADAWRGTPGRV